MKLDVNLKEHSYPIYIEQGLLNKVSVYIAQCFQGKRIIIISDDNVFPHYGQALLRALKEYECHFIVLPHGEKTKDFQGLSHIYKQLLDFKTTRSDLIVALGGGVIGDLVGFVAATYLRGIPFVQIPTSLLAQVDSSVGGKVAVDLPQGKNLVGAFYHPRLVLIDPDVLNTLPTRYINDGMSEVIKYGCIKDKALFAQIRKAGSFAALKKNSTDIIYRCVAIKKTVVEQDPFDKGERMLLNFGHTLGHALEQFYGYERESHGEAVAIGMYCITRLAEAQNLSAKGTAETIKELLLAYDLPITSHTAFSKLQASLQLDKKFLDGSLHLILLKEIGTSYIYQSDIHFFKHLEQV
ncbi:MAG: 3-dehydroquinate synthase [Lachnospiraceae bacterium]|nr:3-dehydroquinate synthase [Lachnospiraceae bacterium]